MKKLFYLLLISCCLISFKPKLNTENVSYRVKFSDPYINTPVALTIDQYNALNPQSSLLAFPTAEGFGKYTTGGRGGTVIHVTTLADSGTGSLREAIETDGDRTIVFDVAGTINLTTKLNIGSANITQNIAEENLTIAGETAPSPGITVTGAGVEINCSNVIIRYITIRVNDGDQDTAGAEDGLGVRNWGVDNYELSGIMIDHVTITHASDECFGVDGSSIVANVNSLTIQNSMMGDNPNLYNSLISSHVYDYSFIGNYMFNTTDRNPYLGYGIADEWGEFINNIVYANGGSLIAWGNHYDLIGNIYKGYDTNNYAYPVITYSASSANNPTAQESDGALYVADNININPPDGGQGFYAANVTTYAQGTRVITNSLKTSWETTQSGIEDRVFNHSTGVGNSIYRETYDLDAINDYTNDTGSFLGYGNAPTMPTKTSTARSGSYDTDDDGMSDSWEVTHYGDLTKTSWGYDDVSGYETVEGRALNTYTNLEKFFLFQTSEVEVSGGSPPTPTPTPVEAVKKKKYSAYN